VCFRLCADKSQKDVATRFDIKAKAAGSIKNKITDNEQSRAKYSARRSLEFSTSNSTSTVQVSTVRGGVKVVTK
jgi:hypothetical protein